MNQAEEKDPLAPYRGRQYTRCAGCEWEFAVGHDKQKTCSNCVATEAARQDMFPETEESY